MRDENGFKCHVQSESHVRQMLVLGENPNKAINDYSKQFEHDFVQQLRTSHNTKPVLINRFYQDYIANKEHVHMNATKWKSLTEFAKYLGREGLARVQETDKGLEVAWVDNSPEALRRQDAVRKKERMDKGDEEREQKLIQEQVERAQERAKHDSDDGEDTRALQRADGEKISLKLGSKSATAKIPTPPLTSDGEAANEEVSEPAEPKLEATQFDSINDEQAVEKATEKTPPAVKMSLGLNPNKPKNVFAARNNPLAGKKTSVIEQPKKMSEAERIMKEEMERKRARNSSAGISFGVKKQKVN